MSQCDVIQHLVYQISMENVTKLHVWSHCHISDIIGRTKIFASESHLNQCYYLIFLIL